MCRAMKKLYFRTGHFGIDYMVVWHLVNEYGIEIVEDSIKSYEDNEDCLPDYGKQTNYVFYSNTEGCYLQKQGRLCPFLEEHYERQRDKNGNMLQSAKRMLNLLRRELKNE